METATQPTHYKNAGISQCKVCNHPEREEIQAAVAAFEPVSSVALRYAGDFSRALLHRHLKNCLGDNYRKRRERLQTESLLDMDSHLAALLNEAQDGLAAAKKVLLVDGELCFDPRAHEVTIVYQDHHDRNLKTGEPKIKTAKLSRLLALIAENGYEPDHSYIKAEDMRKTFRDCISVCDMMLDRVARIKGLYKQVDDKTERLNYLRDTIQQAAVKYGTTYEHELLTFLTEFAHGIRPDLKAELEREYRGTTRRGIPQSGSPVSSGPLAAAAAGVKALPPSTLLPDAYSEANVQIISGEEKPINLQEFFGGTTGNTLG